MPLPLVKAFLGTSPYGEMNIYSDLVSSFPDFTVPTGFSVLGSIDRGYTVSVILGTELSKDASVAALSESLSEVEFGDFRTRIDAGPVNGFVRANPTVYPSYTRFCHDGLGFITLEYQTHSDFRTVSLASSPRSSEQSCAEIQEMQEMHGQQMQMGMSQDGLRQYLPRLDLPES